LRYLIENNKINAEYVKHYTNASSPVRGDDFAFEDGLFSVATARKRQYDKSSWNYQFDENEGAKRDEMTIHPALCVEPAERARFATRRTSLKTTSAVRRADFLKV
jgi:formate dehydrogenase-N alpha subunit